MIRNKQKILVFTAEFPPIIGGLATYSDGISRGLISCGADVTVLAPYAYEQGLFGHDQCGFKVVRYLNIFLLREILLVPYLTFLLLRQGITQILCISWYPCGLIAMFSKWLLGVSYTVKVFGSDVIKKDVSKSKLRHQLKRKFFWLMKLVFNNAEKIFPNSNYTRGILIAAAAPIEKIKVVNPGVDLDRFSNTLNTDLVSERYNLKGREMVLTVARLEDYKGQDMVVNSLAKVIEKAPNIIYLIVGKGSDEKRLKDLVASAGLERYVTFIKQVSQEELVQLYAAASVFIMPSREMEKRVEVEGFGIVFLEANASGKPVIGGNSGGIADVVVDGQTGLIVDPLDTQAISKAILKLILDKDYAAGLGRAARARVKENFTWDKVAARIWDKIKDA